MSDFTHLHVHSHYSLLDGLPKIDELVDHADQQGMDAVALTDHGVLYGAVEFYKKAKAKGIKPIIGCELYEAYERMGQKRPNIDDKRYHLLTLVKNEQGYQNLVKLVTEAHLKGFYYKPRVDEYLLQDHGEGLIGMSACIEGKIPQLLLEDKKEEAKKTAEKYRDIFDEFYLELQHHPNIEEQQELNEKLIELSEELDLPLVATNDVHYLKEEDAEAQDILMLINTNTDRDDPERNTMINDDFSLRSEEKMKEAFEDHPEAIENTQEIKEACNFEFDLDTTRLPQFKVPNGKSEDEYLRELCMEGIEERYEEKTDEIMERLERELSVITEMNFSSYFLIVQDFVNWAKEHHIVVGPGRGSAGGSLVSYLLNITDIDPLKYDLLFERFLNPGRAKVSFPDIDLDFADRRRDEVIEYVADKYGKEKVAQIITFGTMAARGVIRDVGRVLGYSYDYCDKAAKMIPMQMSLDESLEGVKEFRQLYEQDEKAQKLINLGKKLEGVARHASTHACGVVISDIPLEKIIPVQHSSQSDKDIITQYEMHSVEDIGLLKMDFLGLKNLTIIEDTLSRIYEVHGENIDIENLPLDDEKTFEIFRNANTTGIFQLECLAGDTKISNTTIKNLHKKGHKDQLNSVYLDEGKVHRNEIKDVSYAGKKELYTLIAENDWCIKATKEHHFLTQDGWKKLKEIVPGEDKVLVKTKAKHSVYNTCDRCGTQISGQNEGESEFCYKCSATVHSNPSKKEVRNKIKKSKEEFYEQGGQPWNYGKTAEENETLKKTGEKISEALEGQSFEDLYGKEKAKKMKKKISERNKGKKNPMYGKSPPHREGGYREDLGHYVRSSWEADFARILNFCEVDYEYEPKKFELTKEDGGKMHYTPDFYIEEENLFYEIKGFMRDLDKKKIKLFKEQYPQYDFVLVNKTKFAELALEYEELIDWECPRIPLEQKFRFLQVKNTKYYGKDKTYDISMESPGNNFIANGFAVHNSDGMKRYLEQLKPTEFEDIIAMVSLYRPGPMENIPKYIARKHGEEEVEYLHPKLKPILKPTYGIIVYQEQVMKIAQELAGFSLEEADILRKAIGKKIRSLLQDQKEKFINGMKKNDIGEEVAKKIWNWIEPFAEYSFNKSHATAYATIAYRTAYLKAHYPVEFMSALLTSKKNDVDEIAGLIEECREMGIEVLPPDINESFRNFSVVAEEDKIRFGLLAIKNVGESVVEDIVKERRNNGAFESVEDFLSRIDSKGLNKTSLECLIKVGAFDHFEERNKLLSNLKELLEFSKEINERNNSDQQNLFQDEFDAKLTLKEADSASQNQKLRWERELLGLFVGGDPLDEFEEVLDKEAFSIKKIKDDLQSDEGSGPRNPFSRKISPGKKLKVGGMINNVNQIRTKNGNPMLFAQLRGLTDKIEVVVFPSTFKDHSEAFEESNIVIMKGKVDKRDGEPKIICQGIEKIINSN